MIFSHEAWKRCIDGVSKSVSEYSRKFLDIMTENGSFCAFFEKQVFEMNNEVMDFGTCRAIRQKHPHELRKN